MRIRDFTYVSAEQAIKLGLHKETSLTEKTIRYMGARKPEPCENCGAPEWKYATTGMCFSCTTGETDASDDYEVDDEQALLRAREDGRT